MIEDRDCAHVTCQLSSLYPTMSLNQLIEIIKDNSIYQMAKKKWQAGVKINMIGPADWLLDCYILVLFQSQTSSWLFTPTLIRLYQIALSCSLRHCFSEQN